MATLTETRSASTTTVVSSSGRDLASLRYDLIRRGDRAEIDRLVNAATSTGIFFLDLRNDQASMNVYAHVPAVTRGQSAFFERPKEEKVAFASPIEERGWEQMMEPHVEHLQLAREEQIDDTLKLPSDLQTVAKEVREVSDWCDKELRNVSRLLCTSIKPAVATTSIEDPSHPGLSCVVLANTYAPSGVELVPEHLDSAVLSLLYYDSSFLEICDPETGSWKLVEARPGHAVVYVGKQLAMLSDGRFKATKHRVTCPSPATAMVGYFHYASL